MSGTDIPDGTIFLSARHSIWCYLPTRVLCDVRYWLSITVWCPAISLRCAGYRQLAAYARATRCPVLTQGTAYGTGAAILQRCPVLRHGTRSAILQRCAVLREEVERAGALQAAQAALWLRQTRGHVPTPYAGIRNVRY
eukprot:646254-Rhodomonas_salina.1